MNKPSPRLDALREMREKKYEADVKRANALNAAEKKVAPVAKPAKQPAKAKRKSP